MLDDGVFWANSGPGGDGPNRSRVAPRPQAYECARHSGSPVGARPGLSRLPAPGQVSLRPGLVIPMKDAPGRVLRSTTSRGDLISWIASQPAPEKVAGRNTCRESSGLVGA